jgi:uncharacterized protein YecE (DUF72 family)
MQFYLGCAVWGYKDWVGTLFPSGSRSSDFLSLYSQRFTTVEGNTTFYSVPDLKTVRRWASETPDHFRFCLKLPKFITHQGTLAAKIPEAIAFLHTMQPLGERLGPVFAQLPPGYSPQGWNDLLIFLRAWRFDIAPLALEVRHSDWFRQPYCSQLNAALQDLGIGRVLLDTRPIYNCPDDPQLASERKKPNVPLHPIVTTNFSVIRYISHPDPAMNSLYLQEWAELVDQWLRQGTQIFFFVHCPVEARSPSHAHDFQHRLEQQGAAVPPLPWDAIATECAAPTQLSLF